MKQPHEVFYKKGVLKKFVKFTGKHQRRSLFLNKFTCLGPVTLPKNKEAPTQVFSYECSGIFKNTFFRNTSEKLLLNFTNENKASKNEISN